MEECEHWKVIWNWNTAINQKLCMTRFLMKIQNLLYKNSLSLRPAPAELHQLQVVGLHVMYVTVSADFV